MCLSVCLLVFVFVLSVCLPVFLSQAYLRDVIKCLHGQVSRINEPGYLVEVTAELEHLKRQANILRTIAAGRQTQSNILRTIAAGRQTGRQPGRQTGHRPPDRQTDRAQTERQTGHRQTDSQAGRTSPPPILDP